MTSSFHDTRWTLVSRSRGEDTQAKAALSELCAAYYAPVVAFLRRDGRAEDVARDLAHDFFAKLLAGGTIDSADPLRGKFRSYLLMILKRFAANQRDHDHAAKRGGGQVHAVIDGESDMTGAGLQIADVKAEAPDAAFDRQWALTLLARALGRLESEMRDDGKSEHFDALKPWLTAEADATPQVDAATKLGMSIEAVKVAIHRLRKRFREAVKAEIAQTVSDEDTVREELDALMVALRK
ncbi:MAG: sigma-70 family RNA polymerase sigma factor [Prosthecobacter sp.]|uniref:RNA polymerase sigma factor n=1 Tax=Prosthecobacter sp. TaxID=1965333 RepID=UPI0025ED8075|nr:sigma-70 family RNA polymerase sigma factor [Prosthecobacter sp.]MCF7786626.1 sigma-70 family RNA polymerase sigma factor [Prosthecobacter sp.]